MELTRLDRHLAPALLLGLACLAAPSASAQSQGRVVRDLVASASGPLLPRAQGARGPRGRSDSGRFHDLSVGGRRGGSPPRRSAVEGFAVGLLRFLRSVPSGVVTTALALGVAGGVLGLRASGALEG